MNCQSWRSCPDQLLDYALTSSSTSWNKAQTSCSKFGESVTLATPRNYRQGNCFHQLLHGEGRYVWIGISKSSKGDLIFVDNNETLLKDQYNNIITEFPSSETVRCLSATTTTEHFQGGVWPVHRWKYTNCFAHLKAVCQRRGEQIQFMIFKIAAFFVGYLLKNKACAFLTKVRG